MGGGRKVEVAYDAGERPRFIQKILKNQEVLASEKTRKLGPKRSSKSDEEWGPTVVSYTEECLPTLIAAKEAQEARKSTETLPSKMENEHGETVDNGGYNALAENTLSLQKSITEAGDSRGKSGNLSILNKVGRSRKRLSFAEDSN
jgi:hypothetical protein